MVYTLSCGCAPDASGFGYCDACTSALHRKIWKNMSKERKSCDRHIDPKSCEELDAWEKNGKIWNDGGCSCHINPPCDYCINKGEDDE